MKILSLIIFALLGCEQVHSQTIDTLIDLGDYQLHFSIITGKGTPILFEAGNGDDGSVWEPLLQRIYDATGATLITYDRAGLGRSSIDTTKISFARELKHVKRALKQLGYKKDFFLVAHSFGGFYAAEFARRNKRKINGAVFIDTSTPCGLNVSYATKVRNTISDDNWNLIREYKVGLYYVLQAFPEIAAYMSTRFMKNSIPLTVIAADTRTPSKEIGETEQDMINMANCLKEFGRLPNHKYVLAANTGHKVWKDDPKIVIDEIVQLYHQTTKKNQ